MRHPAAIPAFLVLLMTLVTAPAMAEPSAVDRLEQFSAQLDTLSAGFQQEVINERGEQVQASSGVVELARPGRFRWLYQKPYEQSIIADGDTLWIYDVDLDQVTRKPLDEALGSAPIMLLMKREPLTREFELEDAGTERGMEWVALVPREKTTDFDRIRLGFRGATLAMMELKDAFGQLTRIAFTDLVMNPGFPRDHFDFVPPEGVDVVESSR